MASGGGGVSDDAEIELKNMKTWDEDKVGAFLEKEGLGQYKELFKTNHITGKVLPMLQKDDLEELGVSSVGHRVKMVADLARMKAAAVINNRTEVLLRFKHHRMAPYHPFNRRTYTIMPSAIEVVTDHGPCGHTKENINIGGITDVELTGRGCTGMFYSTVVITMSDGGYYKICVHRAKATIVHRTIKRAWEGYQASMAGQMRHVGGY
jgi:hypothetical protein